MEHSLDPAGRFTSNHRKRSTAEVNSISPLRLAWRWERYCRWALKLPGYRLHPSGDPRGSRYWKSFERLSEYLRTSGIHEDDYLSALFAKLNESRGKWKIFPNLLGLPFYNQIVDEFLRGRRERLAGEESGFDRLRVLSEFATRKRMLRDHRRCQDYRSQYRTMSARMFWLHFMGEFSGAFLIMNEDWRRTGLIAFLSPEQEKQVREIEKDPVIKETARVLYRDTAREVWQDELTKTVTTRVK